MEIQDYVNKGCLKPESPTSFRPSGDEVVPRPKPYEAVVFRDFFVAGLDFPIEPFIGEVLEWLEIQLHQLTPNAFARLGVFAMAMKMQGCKLSVYVFIRFYELTIARAK